MPANTPGMRQKRIDVEWNWWPMNRPQVYLCDPDDGEIWVGFHWGNGNSDPVFRFDIRFTGWLARPFITWAAYRWDKAHRKQEARKAARTTSVAPRGGEMEQTVLADAMQDVWNEWCADTGCVPDGFHIHGPGTTRLTADFKISPFPDLVIAALKRSGYQLVKKKPERENRFATGAKLSGEY